MSLGVLIGKGGSAVAAPFSVETRVSPGSDPGANPDQASVYWNSSLLKSIILNDVQDITGLSSQTDPNWFQFNYGNDLIWLEITLDGMGSVTGATIQSYGLGGAWEPADLPTQTGTGSGPFEYTLTFDDNGNSVFSQTKARIPIFMSTTGASVVNIQLLNSNLLMEGDIYVGDTQDDGSATVGLLMPKPYAGPYISL